MAADEGQNIQPGEPPPIRRRNRDEAPANEPRRRPPTGGNDAISSIIPYRNSLALIGYYFGVFSLIPVLGALLGPIALLLGILGLRRVRRNPEAKGTGHAITAIVLGSLATLLNYGVVVFFIVMKK